MRDGVQRLGLHPSDDEVFHCAAAALWNRQHMLFASTARLLLIAQQMPPDTRPPWWTFPFFLASPGGLVILAILVFGLIAWLAADYQRRHAHREEEVNDEER